MTHGVAHAVWSCARFRSASAALSTSAGSRGSSGSPTSNGSVRTKSTVAAPADRKAAGTVVPLVARTSPGRKKTARTSGASDPSP
jgi:hypothetical protein